MVDFKKACTSCRKPFTITVPDPAVAFVAAQAEALLMMCEDCGERTEREANLAENSRVATEVMEMRAKRIAEADPPPLPREFLWPNTEAGALAAAWVERKFPTLTIWGSDVGVGKSTLANAALRRRLEPRVVDRVVQAPRGAWRSMPAYMASLGSGFGSRTRDDAIELTEGRMVLALDDLDKVRPSEYAAEAVFSLVDGLVSRKRSLIVTTNLSIVEIGEKWPEPFGRAIASRLAGGKVAKMTGADRRLLP